MTTDQTPARLLVIAAGGTGGHMFPAQALAQTMLRRGWRVVLSTDARGLRYAGGFPEAVARREVAAATFARGGIAAKALAPFKIGAGVLDTIRWFKRDRPAAVAGFGGYPSLPALAAAWRLGTPRLIHEQNGVLGRVNAAFATRVSALACGVEPVANAPAGAPLRFVGNPVRDTVRGLIGAPYAPPEGDGPINLLIFGGSQGAGVFSRLMAPALGALPEAMKTRLSIVQQARPEDIDQLRASYASLGLRPELAPFFEDMPARIAAAHLVISRAGASSIAELTAIGRPSMLFPYPMAAADHQTANAKMLEAAGAARRLKDEVDPEAFSSALEALLNAPGTLAAMAAAARKLGKPNAADDLADLVAEIAQ